MKKEQLEIVVREQAKQLKELEKELHICKMDLQLNFNEMAQKENEIRKMESAVLKARAETIHFKKLLNQANKELFKEREMNTEIFGETVIELKKEIELLKERER